ncbi:MAG TPA: FecR domain-containing protein [Niabella sp.]|nr:FecR domain-containing protein [Niabella sp.]HOZ95899.1 FecR domain-containing protein [Niabella sp.]HQW15811.1 FecR domain-containing protein [Niabella sp.]HQX20951.1 FecR domain-containing protein [Niabella sp.]HQX41259.1 FecR domain-containing protein [Niabella sp.]
MERLQILFQLYINNNISKEEFEEMCSLLSKQKDLSAISKQLQSIWTDEVGYSLDDSYWEEAIDKLKARNNKPVIKKSFYWWRYAAIIVLVLGTGLFYMLTQKKQQTSKVVAKNIDIKAPDKNRATITLADGRVVYLDDIISGNIATQNGAGVYKEAYGDLMYKPENNSSQSMSIAYNTLSNPKGSTVINLQLSDGTKVWLNAASSLKYPVNFTTNERKVELTGEGYFEVAKDKNKKFLVIAGNTETVVLGTHFNISAYENETQIKTTLIEGSVKINSLGRSVQIRPGQQAITSDKTMMINRGVNISEVLAWKNGLFQFNNTDIKTVMNAISLWYDVEVQYPKGIPKDKYWGSIRRDQNLSDVLKVLKESGARFTIEGKSVVVYPQ